MIRWSKLSGEYCQPQVTLNCPSERSSGGRMDRYVEYWRPQMPVSSRDPPSPHTFFKPPQTLLASSRGASAPSGTLESNLEAERTMPIGACSSRNSRVATAEDSYLAYFQNNQWRALVIIMLLHICQQQRTRTPGHHSGPNTHSVCRHWRSDVQCCSRVRGRERIQDCPALHESPSQPPHIRTRGNNSELQTRPWCKTKGSPMCGPDSGLRAGN